MPRKSDRGKFGSDCFYRSAARVRRQRKFFHRLGRSTRGILNLLHPAVIDRWPLRVEGERTFMYAAY